MCRIFEYGMYFLQFSSVTSVCSQQCLQSCDLERHQKESSMDNIDHASRNLSSSSMRRAAAASAWRNERTYNTHTTNESFFVQENMAKQSDQQSTRCRNESHDLWRPLTVSWDVFSCATSSWSFSESWDPAFQTRAQLDADLCCQCCDMLRPTLPSSTTAVNVFKHEMTQKWVCYGFQTTRATVFGIRQCLGLKCKKNLAVSLRYQLHRNLLRTGSQKNGLQLLHSSPCDLAIVQLYKMQLLPATQNFWCKLHLESRANWVPHEVAC